jgi:hypothetical protein
VTPESDRGDDTPTAAGSAKRTGDDVVGESRWPMAGAVLAAIVLTILLPDTVRLGPQWLLPLIEGVLLVAVIAGDPGNINRRTRWLRALSIVLVSVLVLGALAALEYASRWSPRRRAMPWRQTAQASPRRLPVHWWPHARAR